MDRDSSALSPAGIDFIAGAVAGALSIATTQPLDMVRIRMQTLACTGHGATAAAIVTAGPAAALITTRSASMQMLSCMVRKEGPLSPYKGMSFPLMSTALQSAVIFQVYGSTLRYLEKRQSAQDHERVRDSSGNSGTCSSSSQDLPSHRQLRPSLQHTFLAGSAAGFVQVFLMSPIEMLKIRMQVQTARVGSPEYLGPTKMMRQLMAKEGLTGLYKGVWVTIWRDLPSYGIYFASYNYLAGVLEPKVAPEDASAGTQILAGGSAGCLAWMSIYPLDVIKSRIQAATRPERRHMSWMQCGQAIYQDGGLAALYRGVKPTLARAFVMDAVTFVGYTNVLRLLTVHGGTA